MDERPVPGQSDSLAPPDPEQAARKEQKKKDNARRAWFTFIGRIVAQVVGAVASIVLAIFFLQKAQSNGEREPSAAARPAATRAAAGRSDGRIPRRAAAVELFW